MKIECQEWVTFPLPRQTLIEVTLAGYAVTVARPIAVEIARQIMQDEAGRALLGEATPAPQELHRPFMLGEIEAKIRQIMDGTEE